MAVGEVLLELEGRGKMPDKTVLLADPGNAPKPEIFGPPETVQPSAIYKLYRGATGEVNGQSSRFWADFSVLQLCWATYDNPAGACDRLSLLDLISCRIKGSLDGQDGGRLRAEIHTSAPGGDGLAPGLPKLHGQVRPESSPDSSSAPALVVFANATGGSALQEFAEALTQLVASRDSEGRQGLLFIQKRLFQYLWRHQGISFTEEQLYEAQAVLAFNLEPREGVTYLRGKLGKSTDAEVGEWLAQMAALKGGLDPTMLGAYFSRRDTLEVFKSFVRCLDFRETDMVGALRLLFDTFKPGGEGQVITRILEMFAEAYFLQWATNKDGIKPRTEYKNSDDIERVAVSLIMLNTGLHVAPKKNPGKRLTGAMMTLEEYIDNTRRVVSPEQVPDEALTAWYEAVKQVEISVEPLPRAAFSRLPVQPDIEGWLLLVINSQVQRRYWAVLALQRLYLFSDNSEVEPAEAIAMKDARACGVLADRAAQERFMKDLHSSGKMGCMCFVPKGRADLVDAELRAFEVTQVHSNRPALLQKLTKPRTRLALVAESPDLMEKWVSLISSGPY